MKQIFVIFLIVFSYSCKTQQNSIQTHTIADKMEIVAKKNYTQGEKIVFRLKNNSNNPVIIYRPMEKFFYKKVGDDWKKLNILYCPCDASCPPPAEQQELTKSSVLKISWDQKEDSCSQERINGVRETIKKQVDVGIYRAAIYYSVNSKKRYTYYYEFEIK